MESGLDMKEILARVSLKGMGRLIILMEANM